MNLTVDRHTDGWLDAVFELLKVVGLAIVPEILSETERRGAGLALDRAAAGLREEIGEERWRRAGMDAGGELRLPMKYDAHFYRFLECPELLAIVDRYLSPSAILRFQHGVVARPGRRSAGPWHMNGRRVLNGYRAALEIVFVVEDLEGAELLFALGSHQRLDVPEPTALEAVAAPVAVAAGSMLVFDSTLWHRQNGCERATVSRTVAHQFTRHFFKPHVDYVRALGDDVVRALPERTRRLLGWESRVPASLEEFYVDPAERLYTARED